MALVLDPTKKATFGFKDQDGKRASVTLFTTAAGVDPTAAPYSVTAPLMQACSHAILDSVRVSVTAHEDTPATPGDSAYCSGLDKLYLSFRGEDGGYVKLNLPGPKENQFVANSIKANVSQTDLAALIAYIIANCKTAEGRPLRALDAAFRRSPPRTRRGI